MVAYIKIILLCICIFAFKAKCQPVANINSNVQIGCSPLTVLFNSNSSTGNPTSFLWNFGNGNTSTLANPGANFIVPGTYTVSLKVSNASGTNTETKTAYIKVFAPPIADFISNNNTSGCPPLKVDFTDKSIKGDGAINFWQWDFGDGNLSNTQNPQNIYTYTGNFNIKLVVKDVNGCQGTKTLNNNTIVTAPFKVDISASPRFTCNPPLLANFTDLTSPTSQGYSYLWDFGDGNTSTQKNPSNNYTKQDTYTVKLKVKSPSGCTVEKIDSAYINVGALKADFDWSGNLCVPASLQMLSKSNPDFLVGGTYKWYLDGVLVSSIAEPILNFASAGAHTLKLAIASAGNTCANDITKNITISTKTKPDFIADPLTSCSVPVNVSFNDITIGAKSWLWSFGNGNYSTLQFPSNTYVNKGQYTVRLIIENASGCIDTLTKTDYINAGLPRPVSTSIDPKNGCKPINSTFDVVDNNTIKYTKFLWTFGDGSSSTNKTTAHSYNKEGTYVVTLKAIADDGCEYTVTDSIKVGDIVKYTFTLPDKKICYNTIKKPSKKHYQIPFDTIRKPNSLVAESIDEYFLKLPINKSSLLFNEIIDTGYYKIVLYYWNKGCMVADTSSDSIWVRGPIAKFDTLVLNPDLCRTDSIKFYNRSIDYDSSYWDFGDGDTTNWRLTNPVHVYKNGGIFLVNLRVFNNKSLCWDSTTRTVKVKDKLVPNFKLTDSLGCQPFSTKVIDLTTGRSIVSGTIYYTYLFNGLQGYNSPEPLITITKPGYVSGTLTINVGGCIFSCKKDNIAYVVSGSSSFTATPATGCAPLLVKTNATYKTEYPVKEIKWVWGTGDSLVLFDSITFNLLKWANYTYNQKNKADINGSYLLKLIIKDTLGCTFSSSKVVTPTQPLAKITFVQMDACGYDSVYFDASSSKGNALKYKWFYDDNDMGTTTSLSKNFDLNKTYQIKLIATDANKCTNAADSDLIVNTQLPIADFDAKPRVINCPGPPIYFTNKSIKGEYDLKDYVWEFGDKSTSHLENPAKVYLLPGTYNVLLTVSDKIGCKVTKLGPGFVLVGGPSATYSFTPKLGCTPQTVVFTAISSNTKLYEWDLADGNIDTGQTLKHVYTDPRMYIPTLSITDKSGCKVGLPAIDTIIIRGLPNPDFVADEIKVCKNTDVIFKDLLAANAPVLTWKWGFNLNDTIYTRGPHTRSYGTAGKYSVVLYVSDTSGCVSKILKADYISVYDDNIPPAKPNLLKASVDDNTTTFFINTKNTEEDFKLYRIFYDYDANGIPLQKLIKRKQSDTVFYELGLNTLENTYSYAIEAEDVCKNISPLSNKHTTIELKAKAEVNAVSLSWSKYIGWDNVNQYYIYKINPRHSNNTFELLDSVSDNTLTYIDTNIFCFNTLYYKIKAVRHLPDTQYSWSDTAGATPIYQSTLPATQNIRATVFDNKSVLIQWTKRIFKTPFTYVIFRSKNDEEKYTQIAEVPINTEQYIDTKVDVQNESYTYITYLKDECGVLGPASNKAKSILLKIAIVRDNMVLYRPTLYWSNYLEWCSGVEKYKVEFFVDSLKKFVSIGNTQPNVTKLLHDYLDLKIDEYCYRITAFQQDSNFVISESNIGCVNTEPRLFAPSAFTINNDNLNEVFDVKGAFVKEYKLEIYNRWGLLLFESFDLDSKWDGTYKGQAMPSDVYIYKAWGRGRKNIEIEIQGNVTLLR